MNNFISNILDTWRHKRTYPVIKKLIEQYNTKTFIEVGLGTPGLSTSILYNFQNIDIIGIDTKKNDIYYNLEKEFNDRFKFENGKSIDILNQLKNNSIDMIYIDGSHIYNDVISDLEISIQKIKLGGIISGHDYGNKKWTGVKQAVNEIISKYKLKLHKEDYLNYYFINEVSINV